MSDEIVIPDDQPAPPPPSTPLYRWRFKVQAWRTDPYYVGSSQPVRDLEIVASTENEAKDEARRILPKLRDERTWYYRFFLQDSKDVRLVALEETGR
jgi:hypothetical protein